MTHFFQRIPNWKQVCKGFIAISAFVVIFAFCLIWSESAATEIVLNSISPGYFGSLKFSKEISVLANFDGPKADNETATASSQSPVASFATEMVNLPVLNKSTSFEPEAMHKEAKKFVSVDNCPGRLGNGLFVLASLYGIGKTLRRTPVAPSRKQCFRNTNRIFQAFPSFANEFYQNKTTGKVQRIAYANAVVRYDDVNVLRRISAQHLVLLGTYFASYKYFDRYKNEIRNLLTCNTQIISRAKAAGEQLLGNDHNHKCCIHIRRGDFGVYLKRSDLKTVKLAISYILSYLPNAVKMNISLLFIGDDPPWTKKHFSKIEEVSVYHHEMDESPAVDMCFGIMHCDSIFLTASASTFGFWIAYLGKPKVVMYFANASGDGTNERDIFPEDYFPQHWLRLAEVNGSLVKVELPTSLS